MPADTVVRHPVIDCHCHAGTGDGLTGPWNTTAPLGDYRRRATAAGIDGTVLFAPFSSDYAQANAEVARIVAAEPRRFIGFALVHPLHDRGRVASLVGQAVGGYGFRGIKAHRHDGRLTREICATADRWRLPLLYDVMGDIAPIELFAEQYPQVAFIIPHLGSFADDWRAQRAFIDVLARHRNVHTDTSGVRRFDLLVEAVRRAGPHKVLFGSDGPWLHPGVELAKVRALGLPAPARHLILGGNLLRLLARVRRCDPAATSGRLAEKPRLVRAELPAAADPWARPE